VTDDGTNEIDSINCGGNAVQRKRTSFNATSAERLRAGTHQDRSGFSRQRKTEFEEGTGFDRNARLEVDAGAGDVADIRSVRFNWSLGDEDLQW